MTSNETDKLKCMQTILDFLVEALNTKSAAVIQKAKSAILELGWRVLPHLEGVLANKKLSRDHARRIREVVNEIRLADTTDNCDAAKLMAGLLEALRKKNQRLNEMAAGVLAILGETNVSMFVEEALAHQRSVGYCTRLLEVVGRIATSLDLFTQGYVLRLAESKNEKIRKAACFVIAKTLRESPPLWIRGGARPPEPRDVSETTTTGVA